MIPLTTGETGVRNAAAPFIRETGSRARIDNMRWVREEAIIGKSPLPALHKTTLQGVFGAARDQLSAIGRRDLYRAAKRSLW